MVINCLKIFVLMDCYCSNLFLIQELPGNNIFVLEFNSSISWVLCELSHVKYFIHFLKGAL